MKLSTWWQLLGVLALETAAIFLVALLAQRLIKSGTWRRAIWQVSIFALALLLIAEMTGVARGMASLVRFQRQSAVRVRSRSGGADTVNHSLNVSADFRRKLNERLALNRQKGESDTAPASVPSASAQSTLPDSP